MIPETYTYKPLPDYLGIYDSKLHGKGLFAKEPIPEDHLVTHSHTHRVIGDEIDRLPLGGFINHSNTPNASLARAGNKYYLHIVEDIKVGEEITLDYSKELCGLHVAKKENV